MKYTCLILLWSLFATMALPADNLIQSISIVPCPESITPGTGYFTFSGKTDFTVENEEQAEVARCFSALFTQAAGFTPSVKVGEKKGKISFLTDDALKSEAYHLEITPRQIIVKASDTKGFFYALQTIRQLLPASIEGTAVAETADWSVPAMTIKDEPRFGYRGLMVDVARFFIPKENLLRIIDCMGMLKINTLHLHLVDDNGWRIEIKRYPLLTEIGSRRVDRPGKSFPERRNPRQGEPTVEKGFYTQEDIREIVAYAARHQVEVIPEIEMPAHSNAALASYPLLACPVVDKFIGVLPGLGGNHADVIFCAGNDSVFTFLQGVIDEVVELFPSRYIHLGGDEARKTHWKECPLCQERMRQEGLEDEEALQGYFMARMSKYVQSKGKEAMGWDELTNTRIPDGAIIYEFAINPDKSHIIPENVLYWVKFLTEIENNRLKFSACKGIMFDTNISYSDTNESEMILGNKIAAYGDAKRYIDSFRKGDYALFYSKGRGIIAVGQIVTDTPTEVADEKYHSVRMIVPEKFNGDVKALPALSPNEIKTILKRNFYWASTIKTPFLTGAQVEMLIRELQKKHV